MTTKITKAINVNAKAVKKYIHRRNQIVKVLQSMKLEKIIYEPLDDYGCYEFERKIPFDMEFDQAAHNADLILQQLGINKPNYLKSIEGQYHHLDSYISNREENKR